MSRVLVIGLASTGAAVVTRLRSEGDEVVAVDDDRGRVPDITRAPQPRAVAGATVVDEPDWSAGTLVRDTDLVVPSPLVAPRHPALVLARELGIPVRSEIDVAAERAAVPIIAVTGTNGKTTVTTMIAAMLSGSGIRAVAAGNIGQTLIEVVDDDRAEVFVVEVSSFQLAFAETFRPRVAVMLGIAPDHLDWHETFEHYVWAKSRIFEHQQGDDVLVYDADDAVARGLADTAPAQRVAVSIEPDATSGFRCSAGRLLDDNGDELIPLSELSRAFPHDCTNALAAAAAARHGGATGAGVRGVLRSFATLPHRVALVREHGGVRYYDDSKATNPHASLHALSSFESVVLLAGGRNKGLDLSELRAGAEYIRAVVAFGEAADEIAAAFAEVRPVTTVTSMHDAVQAAAKLAEVGDVVLLSPACASFDAYSGYAERGDDFATEVRAL